MSFLPSVTKLVFDPEQGRTKQKVGIEHDINKIVARYKKSGQMPRLSSYGGLVDFEAAPVFDCAAVGDYQECQERLLAANEVFNRYPASIRRRFSNDVSLFTTFLSQINSDKAKMAEAVALGIVDVRPDPKPDPKKDPEPKP